MSNVSTKISIRSALPNTLQSIRELLSSVGLPNNDLTLEHLKHFLVATTGETLIGCVGLEPLGSNGLLRSLAVSSEHRNYHIGNQLLTEAENFATQNGINTLYLLTTTADKYFQKHNYRVINRDQVPEALTKTTEFSTLCPSTAICMMKTLSKF